MTSPFLQIGVWLLILYLLGFAGKPILIAFGLSNHRALHSLGRVLGFAIWGFLFWIGPIVLPIQPTPQWALTTFGITFSLSGWAQVHNRRTKLEMPAKQASICLWEGGIFFVTFFFFLFLRSFMADVSGSEQVPDFSILNSLCVSDTYPPQDLWFSGHTVNYYYLSIAFFVPLIKATGLMPEFGFNLAMASVMAFLVCLLYSFWREFHEKKQTLLLSVCCLLLGNLAAIYLLIIVSGEFDYYNASRIIPGTINEFPIFSFFVGDLHAHFVSLPITLLAAYLILKWANLPRRTGALATIVSGFLVGIHDGLNSWALPTLLTLVFVGHLGAFFSRTEVQSRNHRGLMWEMGLFVIAAGLSALPFSYFHVKPPLNFNLVASGDRSPIGFFLLHWLPLLVPVFLVGWKNFQRHCGRERLIIAGLCAVSVFFNTATSAFLLVLVYFWLLPLKERVALKSVDVLVLVVLFILLGTEFVYFSEQYAFHLTYDRMNTVFKFHYISWGFLLIAMPAIWSVLSRPHRRVTALVWIISLSFFGLTLLTRKMTTAPTLDGLLWFKEMEQGKAAAVGYLRFQSPKDSVIVEAVARSQQRYSMLSAFSGRATVLGWLGHEGLWRPHQLPDIIQRQNDVEEIYRTSDVQRLKALLRKYGVDYVSLGERESAQYEGSQFEAVRQLPMILNFADQRLYKANSD